MSDELDWEQGREWESEAAEPVGGAQRSAMSRTSLAGWLLALAAAIALGVIVLRANAMSTWEDDAEVEEMVCVMRGQAFCEIEPFNNGPWIVGGALAAFIGLSGVIIYAGSRET